MRPPKVTEAVDRIYTVFAAYARPAKPDFCGHCYDPREIEYFRRTPLREFSPEMARSLVWESHDHWQSTEVYKHYLPMILDALAPPRRCEDMYEDHLFDTLRALAFADWPAPEREAFWSFVAAVHEALEGIDPKASREWKIAAAKLPGGPYRVDDVVHEL
jgi:hypothetical protein